VLTATAGRQRVAAACAALIRSGVMSASGHGNFSARLDDGRLVLTGAGMSSPPEPRELALVRLDGAVEEGHVAPSVAEIVTMHAVIYRERPDAGAVVHTHSPSVTAFALAHVALPCRYEALLRHGQTCAVPVAAWGPRGSKASVDAIARALAGAPGTSAVLLANHGLLAFAPDPAGAAALVVALEEAAEAELAATRLGGAQDFPTGAADSVRRSMSASRPADVSGRGP
jgi:L-ribulose-5-phosphate 4-epimerase